MPNPTQQQQDIQAAQTALANQNAQGVLAYLPRSLRARVFDFFSYTADFNNPNLPSLATQTVPISIQADSHFLATAIAAITFDSTGQTLIATPLWKLLINDAGSGRNLSSAAIFGASYTGTGQLPFPVMPPKLIKASATLNVQLQSTDSANARIVQVVIHGFKVFKMFRDKQTAEGTPVDQL
jgi:hypothetical protein